MKQTCPHCGMVRESVIPSQLAWEVTKLDSKLITFTTCCGKSVIVSSVTTLQISKCVEFQINDNVPTGRTK